VDRQGDAYLLRILPYRSKTEVEGVVVTLIDISRLKQTEQQLRRMSKVFMDAADPVILEDLDGKIIDLNHEAERCYGWTRAELLGQDVSVMVPKRQRRQADKLRRICRRADHVRNQESWRCDKSGRVHPVLLTLSLLTDEEGRPLGIASIAKEISAQKRAEEEAREAVQRRDQFLAMLSHELRNPLHAASSATELIERQSELPAAVREACDVIRRQTRQMARLLDDLLDVSRVTLGKIQLRDEVVDLVPLAHEAVEAVAPLVRQRGHEILVDLDEGPLCVKGDAARLLQVQENLLSNAAKYTPPGGRIWLTVRREQNKAVIRVRDSGVGIRSDMLDKIFGLFVQAESTLDRSFGGMGVGLTLVQTLVRMHKGKVWATSAGPGKGSEFTVEFPLTEERPDPLPANEVVADPTPGVKVIIVEDNIDSRMMLQSLLTLDGHRVLTAEDGLRGLELIEQEHPDVALVDIGLPGLDGYEVARRVRARVGRDHIRLVALTGYGRAEDHAAVREAGFDMHLVKPIDLEKLKQALTSPQVRRR
jgi:two-component system CheB/CheR fusion protein